MDKRTQDLVDRFDRIVARDGGSLTLLAEDASTIRVGYRLGGAGPDCADGTCVLPHLELEKLMTETAARQLPGLHVQVEVLA